MWKARSAVALGDGTFAIDEVVLSPPKADEVLVKMGLRVFVIRTMIP